jgi:hypothetical protein
VKTEDLIVQLARDGRPIRTLSAPAVRLSRWAAGAVTVVAISSLLIGPRADVRTVVQQSVFAWLAILTSVTALLAAASAFVMSVPGAERWPIQRVVPLAGAALWAALLVTVLGAGGEPVRRIVALPIHPLCIIEIAGFGFLTGWPLFSMLKHGAPLQQKWTAAFATLAAVGLGAAATQFLCPIDDPAHQLVGHFLPVILLSIAGSVFGRRTLSWLS